MKIPRLVDRYIKSASATLLLAILLVLKTPFAAADEKLGVRVPEGFEAVLYADDDLAHDIFSMTVDSQGRIVVSGPGYVRILIDSDDDGRADTFKQFADGPKTGAQGMFFVGRDLFCTGDAGLIRYRDEDGDDRADGSPDLFLKAKTGSEHHIHSVQKGPDGWWYLIAGNNAGISKAYATRPTSPIKQPESGTLFRLTPDLSGGEIVADGLRNAYDFAFNRQGDVFTFDSDGERDVSLPWYRPTRIYHLLPGSNAGWVSRSRKKSNAALEMPPVLAEFGRGSPTGMVTYQHHQFPSEYDNALFVLDWTFGRVMAVPLTLNGEQWSGKPISFMTSVGQFGFAPTDIEVGPDGSLYVSVGGRGTRGGVYRVSYKGSMPAKAESERDTATQKLATCLESPQPLSSWSRALWEPLAKELGRGTFIEAALDTDLPSGQRVRAIEILTELHGGLADGALQKLSRVKSAAVRARAVWSYGRTHTANPDTRLLLPFLADDHPLVVRFALEALIGAGSKTDYDPILKRLTKILGAKERFVRQMGARIARKLPRAAARNFLVMVQEEGAQAVLTLGFGYVERPRKVNESALDLGVTILEDDYPTSLKLEAAHLAQLALGDVGPGRGLPAVFDAYAGRLDLTDHERILDPVRIRLAKLYPLGNRAVDRELSRLLAMLEPYNPSLLEKLLAPITEKSHPIDDIHQLIVASRIAVDRNPDHRHVIARALVEIERKIVARGLNQDTNWDDRIGELYTQLVKLDGYLPSALVKQPGFGRPGHVTFLSQIPESELPKAIAGFVRTIQEQDDDYLWSNDVVFVLGESANPAHRQLVRQQFNNFSVRSAVLMVLAQKPQQRDRDKFVEGLESSQVEVLTACVDALGRLPKSGEAAEQLALLGLARRLGTEKGEYPLREKVVQLLRRNTGEKFGFAFGKIGYRPQAAVTQKWTDWCAERYPKETASALGAGRELEHLKTLLADVDWNGGEIARGNKLFESRACASCHGGRKALGPDLAGVALRFSRDDLFTSIAVPNRDVSPRYQTTLVQTEAGKVYQGLVIYQSVDGVTLRNGINQTFRIEADEIALKRKLNTSLMPAGLLKDLKPKDLADLYAYLRSLGRRSASR